MFYNEEHFESNFNFDEDNDYEENSALYAYNSINEDEYDFQDDDKEHLKYYIGLCLEDDEGDLFLGTSISVQTLFKFDFIYIEQYLDYNNSPVHIDIMQLHISEDLTYNVVLKTFWLKIVQRTWRKIFKQRQKIIQMRKSVNTQEYNRLNGKYPSHMKYLPEYSGSIKNSKI